jgi:hypothetical protein
MNLTDDTPELILAKNAHPHHDTRSAPANTDAVAGAEHIHFHYLTSDVRVAPSRDGKRPGAPCEVEMCCHACHQSARIRFAVTDVSTGAVLRADEVDRVRNEFCQAHARCRPELGVDHKYHCDKRRSGASKRFDFSGTGS